MSIEDAVGPILATAFLLGMLAEIVIPREAQPRLRFWRLIGIGFFVISGLINVGLPLILPAHWVVTHSLLPGHRLGFAGGFALGFVAWTFVYYWYHRSEHRFDAMWRGLHQLHHSPRRVDAAGFAFAHPFDVIAQTVLSLVVMIGVLGLDTRAVALVGLYAAIAELVQHLNVGTPRWLEWFMQRPEAHQRHHEFGQHAGNYADWPVWDKLFGTYRAPATAPLAYGFEEAATRRVGAMLACLDVNSAAAPIVRHD
jgi:sterol desaturase/sphingolipid hydroxylase (fatty acid hydroxylase superfamily)